MYVLIIGGGRTGSHLAEQLLGEGHEVRVIENRAGVLAHLHQELPTEVVYEGDGTDTEALEAVEIRRAHVVAAVTEEDADNLMAASLARHEFNVPRTICRVNDARNAWLFTAEFGVDVALSQAEIMAKLIAEEMSLGDMVTMLKLRKGKYSIVEEKIFPGAKAVKKAIKDLGLPDTAVITGIIRHGEIVLPRGTTILEEADEIIGLVDESGRAALANVLGRPEDIKEKSK